MPDPLIVYHNPACSNSRGTLEILRDRGVDTEVIEYLKTPADAETLRRMLRAIAGPPSALVRKDRRFDELGLDPADYDTEGAVVALLVEHPELMQRPVVFRGERAVIARPPETVLGLLD